MTSSIFTTRTTTRTTGRTARRTVAERLLQATTRSAVSIVASAVAHSLRPAGTIPSAPVRPAQLLSVIDDPEGGVRLIGVSGRVDCAVVAELAAAVEARCDIDHIHIDFTTAEILPEQALDSLETMLDQAERCGVRLRVVGLDPEHPALRRRTTR